MEFIPVSIIFSTICITVLYFAWRNNRSKE